MGVSEITKIIKMIFITFVCSLELDIKVLLLKTSQTLITEHEEIKVATGQEVLFLMSSFHSIWKCFAVYFKFREVINNVNPVNYSNDWSGKITIICLNIMRETEQFMFGFKDHLEERNSWLLL